MDIALGKQAQYVIIAATGTAIDEVVRWLFK